MFTYYICTDNFVKQIFYNMWTTEISRKTTATKEQIWHLWADVSNWNAWDKEVEISEIFGEFKKGTKGVLKPVGGPKAKFEVTEFTNLKSFTSSSFLPLCKMDFIHSITERNNGIDITHKIVMSGLMTFLFSKVIGKKVKIGLPIAVKKLIEIAEKRNHHDKD